MIKSDRARLRKELRARDDDYLRRWRVGYVGLWLPEHYARDWDIVAAWLSGQDAALAQGRQLTQRALAQRERLLSEGYLALAPPALSEIPF